MNPFRPGVILLSVGWLPMMNGLSVTLLAELHRLGVQLFFAWMKWTGAIRRTQSIALEDSEPCLGPCLWSISKGQVSQVKAFVIQLTVFSEWS